MPAITAMRASLFLLGLAAGRLVGWSRRGRRRSVIGPIPASARPMVSPGHRPFRIGILIVAYNALTTVSSVLKRIPVAVWDQIEEVAVFDDASGDATFELAVGVKTLFGLDKLTVFRNARNLGYGGNQKRGYAYFLEKGFDIVVLLHGDGQYAPEVLADLYAPIVEGQADAVFGSRMLPDYGGPLRGGMPLYKYLGNRILTTYANRGLGLRLSEFHSGYRAYRLAALRDINRDSMTDDFHFDTQIIIKLHHQGFRICEVPIPTYYGNEICYVNGLKYARDVYRAVRRYRQTLRGITRHPEYAEYAAGGLQAPVRGADHDPGEQMVGAGSDRLPIG